MPKSALSIIAEQLPNFLREQQAGGARGFVKGLGDLVGLSAPRTERSVFDSLSEEDTVRATTHFGAGAGVAATPVLRALGPAVRTVARHPLAAGMTGAALTGDPTWLLNSPAGQLLSYSGDAEASKFTDSLKAIDKFIAAHGTPHIFPPTEGNPLGAFDMSKLNTGEGAQAFMAGHYLAGDPKISRVHYRDRLVDAENLTAKKAHEAKVANEYFKALGLKQTGFGGGNKQELIDQLAKGNSAEAAWRGFLSAEPLKGFHQDVYNYGYHKSMPPGFLKSLAETAEYPSTDKFAKSNQLVSRLTQLATDPMLLYSAGTQKELTRLGKELRKYRDLVDEAHVATLPEARRIPHKDAIVQYLAAKVPSAELPLLDDMFSLSDEVANFAPDAGLASSHFDRLNLMVRELKNQSQKGTAYRKAAEKEQTSGSLPDLNAVRSRVPAPNAKQGALYSVLVNESPGNMLPLDMTLKDLRLDLPEVYARYDEALRAVGQPGLEGRPGSKTVMDTWYKVPKNDGTPLKLTDEMNKRGLQGNLFLASGRRKLDTDTEFDPKAFNYVIFNDEVPQIIGRELGEVPKFQQGGLTQATRK